MNSSLLPERPAKSIISRTRIRVLIVLALSALGAVLTWPGPAYARSGNQQRIRHNLGITTDQEGTGACGHSAPPRVSVAVSGGVVVVFSAYSGCWTGGSRAGATHHDPARG